MKRATGEDVWATHIVDAIPDIENVADAISARPRAIAAQDPLLSTSQDADGAQGRWGRCVYEGMNDVVDQQVVNVQYENGVTAGFTMVSFAKVALAAPRSRTLNILQIRPDWICCRSRSRRTSANDRLEFMVLEARSLATCQPSP